MAVSPGSACMIILDGAHFTLLYFSFPDADADTGMQAGLALVCHKPLLTKAGEHISGTQE